MLNEKVVLVNSSELKINVVARALKSFFPARNFSVVDSTLDNFNGDSISREECLKSMRLKIKEARLVFPDASYYIFMRGRMEDFEGQMEEFAMVVVEDSRGHEGVSNAASFEVPAPIAELVRRGVSFSTAVEEVYKVTGVKNSSGFVGILTDGVVMKEEQYFQPTVIALATCSKRILGSKAI